MRKVISWVLAALMILSCAALSEGVSAAQKISVNSFDAVRTATDLYLAVPAKDAGEVLVRLPLGGGDAICVDTADHFENLTAYSGGAAYLKTTANATSIACCVGNNASTLYGFGSNTISDLSVYGDELLVLNGGLLFSINPNKQTSLRLSSAQMLDYVLGQDCAYYISDSDKMEYTAQLGDSTNVTAQAGCIYRLDLKTAETELLLKSGCTDLKISGDNLFFHNLADAYAMRTVEGADAQLCGRLYSLDSQLKTLNKECAEPDNGFWIADGKAVVLYNGALNVNSENGNVTLYTPENGASVYSDGNALYVWEPGKNLLTEVRPSGETTVLYEKDLTGAVSLSDLIPIETAAPEAAAEPAAEPVADTTNITSDWFDTFVANTEAAEKNTQKSSPNPAVPAAQSTAVKGSTVTTTESVKLRSGGGSNFSQVGTVPAGTSMTCLGSTTSSTGTTWYEVEYNGVTGYIYAGYAELSGDSASEEFTEISGGSTSSGSTSYTTGTASGKYAHIKKSAVNLRKGPGTAYAIITSIPVGAYATFNGKTATNKDGTHWYNVTYNGHTGWISRGYATLTNSKDSGGGSGKSTGPYDMDGNYIYTVDGSVHIRKSYNKDSKSLGTVSKGVYLDFLNKGATDARGVRWYKVEYGDKVGWVSSRYCVVKNSKGGGGDDYVKTTGSVNLRTGPGLKYKTCGSVKSGKKLEYRGTTKKDDRGVRWYKVRYNGNDCWISSRYSTLIS